MDGKSKEIGVPATLRAVLFRAIEVAHRVPDSAYETIRYLIGQYHTVPPESIYIASSDEQLCAYLALLKIKTPPQKILLPALEPTLSCSSQQIFLGTFNSNKSLLGIPFAYLVALPSVVEQLEQTFYRMSPSIFHLSLLENLLGSPTAEPALPPRAVTESPRAKSVMVQGVSSDAGKSIIATALCRIMVQDGYKVAPFKAQNMALNSAVTPDGGEIGRAQAVQAQACKIDPDTRMNPLLLKPHSDVGAQIIVRGKAVGNRQAKDFHTAKEHFSALVCQAYDELAQEYEVVVLEGAGSPGEVNIKENDIVNMAMAHHAQSPVLLVGDIDRGGVYASFLGTYHTFDLWERELLYGFLVNRFRGDASLLTPAHEYIQTFTGKPVCGVVPYITDLAIPDEDSVALDAWSKKGNKEAELDVAILWLPHIANFTDFAPLGFEPDIALRLVREVSELGTPDLLILPGSKSVVPDLQLLRQQGFEPALKSYVTLGGRMLAVCGGLQMCGVQIDDPYAIESEEKVTAGLGFLPLVTTMEKEKTVRHVQGVRTPFNHEITGYEIHHGVTHAEGCEEAFFCADGTPLGFIKDKIWSSYLHGLLDDNLFRWDFVELLRKEKGLKPYTLPRPSYDVDKALDRLAEVVRGAIDMDALYHAMGLKKKETTMTKDRA